MPGFFVSNISQTKQVVLNNYRQEKCIKDEILLEEVVVKRNVLDTFQNDKIFVETDDLIIVIDGVIFNSSDIMKKFNCDVFSDAIINFAQEDELFFKQLDGSHSGAIYYKKTKCWYIYTNILGDRAIFYYYNNGKYIIGSQLNYITDCMKALNIDRRSDIHGISCLLDYGFFLDDSTCIENVKRLYPGEYITIKDGKLDIKEYYLAEYSEVDISVDDAIEKLDNAFCNAMKKIANKNNDYGYKNVLDISGGMDSRMICYTAKRLNLEESILISYSQSDSNEAQITKKIANELGFDYYYKTLDNGKCLREIDELLFMNNGASYYYGITGGKDFLEILDNRVVGMEFTGLLGDIYEGSFLTKTGLDKPALNMEQYRGTRLLEADSQYTFSNKLDKFKKNDTFWLYTRGMLAGMGTFFIRQNFIEPVTPYGDRDFLEVYLSIPWTTRVNERVLFKWFMSKYPTAAKIPYAATGISPINDKTFFAKIKIRLLLYIKKGISLLQKKPLPHNMNPAKFWLRHEPALKDYIDRYYDEVMQNCKLPASVKEKIEILYNDEKDFNNKAVALTVLGYYKLFLA